jgi:hypothetical protein
MPYQKMYAILCGAISDAIDALPLDAKTFYVRVLLQKTLTEAEEILLSWEENESQVITEKEE